jgi:hypothetical protein
LNDPIGLRGCLDTPAVWRSLALAKHDGHDNSYQHRQADDCNNVHRNSLSPLYAIRETLLQTGA